ncbi:MAG: hypothetical protein AABY18_04370 [Candidatus Thermoplasmatota archaeon]
MVKALPVMGILGAFFAAVLVAILVDAAVFVVVLVTLTGSVILVAQRTIVGAVAGIVVLILTVLAALGMAGSVTTKNGSADFGISEDGGILLGLAACLAVPMGALAARWEQAAPRWLAYAGIAAAVVALAMALANPAALDDNGTVYTLVTALFALAAMAPMVPLVRAEGDAPRGRSTEPAPLASADSSVGPGSAASKRAPGRRP